MAMNLREKLERMREVKILIPRLDKIITLLNQVSAVQRGQNHHKIDDTIVDASVAPSSLALCQTMTNSIKAKYNTHIGSTSFHPAADVTNAVATADQSDLATGMALANAVKAAFNAHIILMSSHITKDDSMTVTVANATDLDTLRALLAALQTAYNSHVNRIHHPASLASVLTLDVA
jgi:hypothetical protein